MYGGKGGIESIRPNYIFGFAITNHILDFEWNHHVYSELICISQEESNKLTGSEIAMWNS